MRRPRTPSRPERRRVKATGPAPAAVSARLAAALSTSSRKESANFWTLAPQRVSDRVVIDARLAQRLKDAPRAFPDVLASDRCVAASLWPPVPPRIACRGSRERLAIRSSSPGSRTRHSDSTPVKLFTLRPSSLLKNHPKAVIQDALHCENPFAGPGALVPVVPLLRGDGRSLPDARPVKSLCLSAGRQYPCGV